MAEFKEILAMVVQVGIVPVVLLLLAWKAAPKLMAIFDKLYDLIDGFVTSMQRVNESNAQAIQELKTNSTQSGSNHEKTHGKLDVQSYTLQQFIDAALIWADSIPDEEAKKRVKFHLEKARSATVK